MQTTATPGRTTPIIPTKIEHGPSPNRWYLAYGSNLSSKVFQGRRGIRPLTQINVSVPSLELVFDLPGFPYLEPAFGNVRLRKSVDQDKGDDKPALIGVAYLLTAEDYARVFASEGGGSAYKEIVVECWCLPKATSVEDKFQDQEEVAGGDSELFTTKILAYTLLAPDSKRRLSPLQPSKRYIELIRSGARENGLPPSYVAYLDNITHYRITSFRQRLGAAITIVTWMPMLLTVVLLQKIFVDSKTGQMPTWLARTFEFLGSVMWRVYEIVLKECFGSGEVTECKPGISLASGGNMTEAKKLVARKRDKIGAPVGKISNEVISG